MKNQDLTTIAIFEMTSAMSRDIPGMKDFLSYFVKQLPKAQRALVLRYVAAKDGARDGFLAQAEADGWDKPSSH